MNKRRGFYDETILVTKVTGFDEKENEITEDVSIRVRGHFSMNFWSIIENHIQATDLQQVLQYFSSGVNMAKLREMVYFSHLVYCDETGAPRKFQTIQECGDIIEQAEPSFSANVLDAFSQSQLISQLLEEAEKILEKENEENPEGK